MKNVILTLVALTSVGVVSAGCGDSTAKKTTKMLSALTSNAQNSLLKQSSEYRAGMVRARHWAMNFSGCSGETTETTETTCTATELSDSVGCTVDSGEAKYTCTLTADVTSCCGNEAYIVKSGSTSTIDFDESSSSYTGGSLDFTVALKTDSVVSGDGFSDETVKCDYSTSFSFKLEEFVAAFTEFVGDDPEAIASMSCEELTEWTQENMEEFFTITVTAAVEPACTVGSTEISAAELQEIFPEGRAACQQGLLTLN